MTSTITVRKHKGRSGQSVYEWRVYRVTQVNAGRTITTQLAKCRSQEQAEKAADHYRKQG